MGQSIPPLRFVPIFKSAMWGGRRLASMLPDAPASGPISEAWLLSDVDDNVSVVADGPLAGTTLRDLVRNRRRELFGESASAASQFPLLVKLIDAREPLSVQVHPNDQQAQRLAGLPYGKTEAWLILHAEPGAKVYAGFRPGVDRNDFLRALESDRVAECLHSFEPKPGDCILLPAGTIHAAGGGLTILEIQQTSDITYRLFDWGRVDPITNKPRALHVEAGLECLDFDQGPVNPIRRATPASTPDEKIVSCQYFDIWQTSEPARETVHDPTNCRVLVCLQGSTKITRGAATAEIRPWDVVLVPAGETWHRSTEPVTFLDIWVP